MNLKFALAMVSLLGAAVLLAPGPCRAEPEPEPAAAAAASGYGYGLHGFGGGFSGSGGGGGGLHHSVGVNHYGDHYGHHSSSGHYGGGGGHHSSSGGHGGYHHHKPHHKHHGSSSSGGHNGRWELGRSRRIDRLAKKKNIYKTNYLSVPKYIVVDKHVKIPIPVPKPYFVHADSGGIVNIGK